MRIDTIAILIFAALATAASAVAQCTKGVAPNQLIPFFGNVDMGLGTTVTIYGDKDAEKAPGLLQTVTGAATTWNKACPTSAYPNIPTFQLNWSQEPPSNAPNASHLEIEVQFDSTDAMPKDPSTGQITPSLFQPAQAGKPETIVLYTRCPPSSSGVTFPQINCTGSQSTADWTTAGAQVFVEHEIGHALGLNDVSSSCPGVMGDPPSANATISLLDCNEIQNLNNAKSPCNNVEPVPGQTTNPCDAASKPPRIGGGPAGLGGGAGGGFCTDYPWICDDGGPGSWRGSGITCNYGCAAVFDDFGEIISDGCSWGCFAEDAEPLARQEPRDQTNPAGVAGPVMSVTSPSAGQTVTGVINVSGWAMQYFGNALLSVGVDGVAQSVHFTQGISSPQACEPPAGVINYACNGSSGFSGTLDTRTLANGRHTLDMVAISLAGWPTSLEVPFTTANSCFDTQPPAVSVSSPAQGAVASGVVSVTVAAADNVAVTQASLYVDGAIVAVWSAPPYVYSWNTSPLTPGVHTLQARAADGCANTAASTVVSVNVARAQVRLNIDLPAPNGTVAGLSFGPFGWATDSYGITSLAFAMDGQSLALTSPYDYGVSRPDVCSVYPGDPNCPYVGWGAAFDSTAFSNGSHVLSVTATDGDSQQGAANWPIVISNVPPAGTTSTITWIEPQALAGFGPPGSLIVAGQATGGLAGAGVHMWWRDVTAGGAWVLFAYAPPPSGGTWLSSIANVNDSHTYAVYTVFSGVTSTTCTYGGNGATNWCM